MVLLLSALLPAARSSHSRLLAKSTRLLAPSFLPSFASHLPALSKAFASIATTTLSSSSPHAPTVTPMSPEELRSKFDLTELPLDHPSVPDFLDTFASKGLFRPFPFAFTATGVVVPRGSPDSLLLPSVATLGIRPYGQLAAALDFALTLQAKFKNIRLESEAEYPYYPVVLPSELSPFRPDTLLGSIGASRALLDTLVLARYQRPAHSPASDPHALPCETHTGSDFFAEKLVKRSFALSGADGAELNAFEDCFKDMSDLYAIRFGAEEFTTLPFLLLGRFNAHFVVGLMSAEVRT